MARCWRGLKRGQILKASIVEVQRDGYLVVSYLGSLLRVKDERGGGSRQPGVELNLIVLSVDPLSFSVQSACATHLNRFV